MASVHPSEVIENAVAVLNFVRRQESRTADLRDIAERQLRQTAVVRSREDSRKTTGIIQDLRATQVGIDLVALRVDAVVSQPELVDQLWPE